MSGGLSQTSLTLVGKTDPGEQVEEVVTSRKKINTTVRCTSETNMAINI